MTFPDRKTGPIYQYAMTLKLKLTPAIYLVGFMGSGKTTVGAALADELGWGFFDLDAEIERQAGQKITSIFAEMGEDEFRQIERMVLMNRISHVRKGLPQVVALGGGAFTIIETRQLAIENGVTIWLDAPIEVIEARVANESHRPLALDAEKMRALFFQRQAAYQQADYRIDATGSRADVVARILALPLFVP